MGTADDLKVGPFWKWIAESGRRIVLADVPLAIPDESYGGKQVWGWGLHVSPWNASSVPNRLLADLLARFGPHPGPDCHGSSTATQSLLRLRSRLIMGIERRTAILQSLIDSRDWDFFCGVYAEPHCAGHLMWHLEDESHPRHSREQVATVGHALRDVYSACDRALGDLLSSLDADTPVAVFLSHGMGPNHHAAHLFPTVLERFNRRCAGTRGNPEPNGIRGRTLDSLWKTTVARLPA